MRLIVALFALITFSLQAASQKKHALIIAIGAYPDPATHLWKPISSANDVPLIRGALEKQNFTDITLLQDAKATKEGILTALDKLIASVGKNSGDIVVIHVSSHGSQIEDDNGDEADGLDEAIVPYGATYTYNKEDFYKYAPGYLRDDEFGEKITQLRNKLGSKGDLLVVLDACHSGSGTRGGVEDKNAPNVRGSLEPMISNKPPKQAMGKNADFSEATATVLAGDASPYVVISGAQASEKNYECWDDNLTAVGSLSYAFSKALTSMDPGTSYRSLFAGIENIMLSKAPKQKPVMETDNSNRGLFAGAFVAQQPYFTINLKASDKNEIVLNAGSVAGLTTGSVVELFPSGTASTKDKKPLATGKITRTDNFSAVLKLEKPNADILKTGAWAFVSEIVYDAKPLRIDITDAAMAAKLKNELKDFSLAGFAPPYDLQLSPDKITGQWVLLYKTSGDKFGAPMNLNTAEGIAQLKQTLKTFDKVRYLREMDIAEQGLNAKVELLLVKNGQVDEELTKSRYINGRMEIKEGDQVRLRVINTGDKAFYVNIVDIQPDGIINPILPNRNLKDRNKRPAPITAPDCRVNRGDTLNILNTMNITISPPYGNEVFKVFLSSDMLDLEEILVTPREEKRSGTAGRGSFTKMESLFRHAETDGSGKRGGGDIAVDADQTGTTFSLPFNIVRK